MIVGIATGFKDVSGALSHDLVLRRLGPQGRKSGPGNLR